MHDVNCFAKRSWLAGVACGMLALLVPDRASATIVTFNFTGTVTLVDTSLATQFSPGQILNLTYTIESTAAPRSGSNANLATFDALTPLSFTVGSYAGSSANPAVIGISNSVSDPMFSFPVDIYQVGPGMAQAMVGPDVGGWTLDGFGLRLLDSTDTVFSTALALPTSLSLSSFDSEEFVIFFRSPDPSGGIDLVLGTLTRSVSPAPEPSSVVYLGVALVGLMRLRSRRPRALNRASRPL